MNSTTSLLSNSLMIFLTAVLFTVTACNAPPAIADKKAYFDLTGFLDQQIALLYKDSFMVMKTSSINQNTEQHEMPWTDWRKELAVFYASDINKAAYVGKYEVDTMMVDSTEKKIIYKSSDADFRTLLMEVTYSLTDQNVTLIHISNYSHNIIYTNSEELYFKPLETYIIKSTQYMKLFGETTFAVKGDFVQKKRSYF